jgi:hypothetical protein
MSGGVHHWLRRRDTTEKKTCDKRMTNNNNNNKCTEIGPESLSCVQIKDPQGESSMKTKYDNPKIMF